MTDYLAAAMEQAQSESGPATEVAEEDFSRSGKGLLGAIFSRWKRRPPDPQKRPQRGDFDFPPLDSPLKRPKGGNCGSLPLDFLPGRSPLESKRRGLTP